MIGKRSVKLAPLEARGGEKGGVGKGKKEENGVGRVHAKNQNLLAFIQSQNNDLEGIKTKASANLERWKSRVGAEKCVSALDSLKNSSTSGQRFVLGVVDADWGVTAGNLTRRFGKKFTVLNMANASIAGGPGFVPGWNSQEADLFRRTSCIFQVKEDECTDASFGDKVGGMSVGEKHAFVLGNEIEYTGGFMDLVNAQELEVRGKDASFKRTCFLNVEAVCFLGPSREAVKGQLGFSHAVMPPTSWFPFHELRCAALNVSRNGRHETRLYRSRNGLVSTEEAFEGEMKKRVFAQFHTCMEKKVPPFLVLGGFGCGIFGNDPAKVSEYYRDALQDREISDYLAGGVVVFATYEPLERDSSGLTSAFRDGLQKAASDGSELKLVPYLLPDPNATKKKVADGRGGASVSVRDWYDGLQSGGWVGGAAGGGGGGSGQRYLLLEDYFGLNVGSVSGSGVFNEKTWRDLRSQMRLAASGSSGRCVLSDGFGGYVGACGRFGLPSYEKLYDLFGVYELESLKKEFGNAGKYGNVHGLDLFGFEDMGTGGKVNGKAYRKLSNWQHVYDEYWEMSVARGGGKLVVFQACGLNLSTCGRGNAGGDGLYHCVAGGGGGGGVGGSVKSKGSASSGDDGGGCVCLAAEWLRVFHAPCAHFYARVGDGSLDDSRNVFLLSKGSVNWEGQNPRGVGWNGNGMIFLWDRVFSSLESVFGRNESGLPRVTSGVDISRYYDEKSGYLVHSDDFKDALNNLLTGDKETTQRIPRILQYECRFCIHSDTDIAFPASAGELDCGLPGRLLGASVPVGDNDVSGNRRTRVCTQVLGAIPFGRKGGASAGASGGGGDMVQEWGPFARFMILNQYDAAWLVALMECLQHERAVHLVVGVPEGVRYGMVVTRMEALLEKFPWAPIRVHVQVSGSGSGSVGVKGGGGGPPARPPPLPPAVKPGEKKPVAKPGVKAVAEPGEKPVASPPRRLKPLVDASSGGRGKVPSPPAGESSRPKFPNLPKFIGKSFALGGGGGGVDGAEIVDDDASYKKTIDSVKKSSLEDVKRASQERAALVVKGTGNEFKGVKYSIESARDDGNCFYAALYLALKHAGMLFVFLKAVGLLNAVGSEIALPLESGNLMETLYKILKDGDGSLSEMDRNGLLRHMFTACATADLVEGLVQRNGGDAKAEECFFIYLVKDHIANLLAQNDAIVLEHFNAQSQGMRAFLQETLWYPGLVGNTNHLKSQLKAWYGDMKNFPYCAEAFRILTGEGEVTSVWREYTSFHIRYTRLWGVYATEFEVVSVEKLMEENQGQATDPPVYLGSVTRRDDAEYMMNNLTQMFKEKSPSGKYIVLYHTGNHYDWVKFEFGGVEGGEDAYLAFGGKEGKASSEDVSRTKRAARRRKMDGLEKEKDGKEGSSKLLKILEEIVKEKD